MKFSLTIPQLFYDVIARVIPGFLFYCIIKFLLIGFNITIPKVINTSQSNFASTIGSGLGALVLFYFIGTILNSFVFMSCKKSVKQKFNDKVKNEYKDKEINDLYQCIRLKNESAGFRLVKLRAEAKFVDISRSFLFFLLVIFCLFTLLHLNKLLIIPNYDVANFLIKFSAMLLMIIGLKLQEDKCWDRYYGNIVRIYPLVCLANTGASEQDSPSLGK